MGWLDKKRRNKYGAIGVRYDGYYFDSKAEGDRYLELKLREKAKEIAELDIHKRFDLEVCGQLICQYEVDFFYIELPTTLVVEDVKGFMTDASKLKIKLFKALYPAYDFRLIKRSQRLY